MGKVTKKLHDLEHEKCNERIDRLEKELEKRDSEIASLKRQLEASKSAPDYPNPIPLPNPSPNPWPLVPIPTWPQPDPWNPVDPWAPGKIHPWQQPYGPLRSKSYNICSVCGIDWSQNMGFVCNNFNCPTGTTVICSTTEGKQTLTSCACGANVSCQCDS
jgi:hypothetical protein